MKGYAISHRQKIFIDQSTHHADGQIRANSSKVEAEKVLPFTPEKMPGMYDGKSSRCQHPLVGQS